jgi:hypothetical protein
MPRIILIRLLLLAAAVALAWSGLSYVSAQSGTYDLSWNSVDGGGAKSTNNGYAVNGSIGQPDAGLLNGGAYGLRGGFWSGVGIQPTPTPVSYHVYLPLTVKQAAAP